MVSRTRAAGAAGCCASGAVFMPVRVQARERRCSQSQDYLITTYSPPPPQKKRRCFVFCFYVHFSSHVIGPLRPERGAGAAASGVQRQPRSQVPTHLGS